jgi:hypothetical protein
MKYLILLFILLLSFSIVSAECIDSDSGKNKYEYGGVTHNGETNQDKCDKENIVEYFCTADDIASFTLLPCVNGCEEGACLLGNDQPRLAPEVEKTSSSAKFYVYGAVILLIIGLYFYWLKFKKKRRF